MALSADQCTVMVSRCSMHQCLPPSPGYLLIEAMTSSSVRQDAKPGCLVQSAQPMLRPGTMLLLLP